MKILSFLNGNDNLLLFVLNNNKKPQTLNHKSPFPVLFFLKRKVEGGTCMLKSEAESKYCSKNMHDEKFRIKAQV